MKNTGDLQCWQQLFARRDQWSQERAEWQRSQGGQLESEQRPATFPPASEAQIAREEARLGTRLPPALRSFYLHSNGCGQVGHSIWAVRSVEQLGWLRDVDPHLYEMHEEDDPEVARCLVVSLEGDASWWLLDPADTDDCCDWRAGRWSSWNPGMRWIAEDFFGLFENEVATAELALQDEKHPPPPPGTGRSWNEHTVGHMDSSTAAREEHMAPNGYKYVPAEGFASIVTISAPATARVGEWIQLSATRRSGPWNLVKQEEIRRLEIGFFKPLIFEPEVAGNLSWSIDPPPDIGCFNTAEVPDHAPLSRAVKFEQPGAYTLRACSAFPLRVHSNAITIKVE
jgi:hypothetical protein